MRRISFAITAYAIRNQSKTVTRRKGWGKLRPGDLLQPVDRVMGFKKGERPIFIGGPIRVVSVRREAIDQITQEDCAREGFPKFTPRDFILMFCDKMGCKPSAIVTRIEFEYTEAPCG